MATRFQTPFIWDSVQAPRIHIHSFTTNYNNISYMLESINCVHDCVLFGFFEKPLLFLWEGFIKVHNVWIHWSPWTTKTWLIILLSFSGTRHEFKGIKMLSSCQVWTIWCLIGWGFVTTMLITTCSLKFKISMVVWWTLTVHITCYWKPGKILHFYCCWKEVFNSKMLQLQGIRFRACLFIGTRGSRKHHGIFSFQCELWTIFMVAWPAELLWIVKGKLQFRCEQWRVSFWFDLGKKWLSKCRQQRSTISFKDAYCWCVTRRGKFFLFTMCNYD